jgi:uncharacterized protein
MENISQIIAQELTLNFESVYHTINLLNEENTVPFIARYRKEVTGNLDEVQIREIERKLKYYTTLKERKETVLESIEAQGKLTDELKNKIIECSSLSLLEDIYLPYKPKRKTRASVAKEQGLEPLAEKVLNDSCPEQYAKDFINLEKGVESEEQALKGAMDIVAEMMSEDFEIRNFMKQMVWQEAILETNAKNMKEQSEFEMYKEYKEPLKQIKPHRILAIMRGERLDEITLKMIFPNDEILSNIYNYFIIKENRYIRRAIEDGYKRLLKPSIERETTQTLLEKAEEQAIVTFSKNLSQLLMQKPLKGRVILGIDPGIRTGSKYAAISFFGEVLDYGVFNQKDLLASSTILKNMIAKHSVKLVAIGNGTGSKEVETIVAKLLSHEFKDVKYALVPETGASVYSASEAAREEFPDLDVTIRGAISIARRLQDPISEYVKIEPKSLGVGQYQHDVNQTLLSEELSHVVEDCVNQVGVNLNTASYELLKHVSGLSSSLARKIVLYRRLNGQFKAREELKNIKGLGDKVFEQAAGFLKIPISQNILDNTWVHPENYPLALEILKHKKDNNRISLSRDIIESLKTQFKVKESSIKEIILALEKPNLDPRDELDTPLLKEDITSIENLQVGMKLKGTVRNLVDFGAFVDIGIKNDGLVHISEITNKYIKHPLEVLEIGNIVDVSIIEIDPVRERVKLSIKKAKE